MNKLLISLLSICTCIQLDAQNTDSLVLRNFFNTALTEERAYKDLEPLCNRIGARLSGSVEAKKAVKYTTEILKRAGADTVFLQPVMVPHWVRGDKEQGAVIVKDKKYELPVCALGGSVATPGSGVVAEVVEVNGLSELKNLGKEKLNGKIVFFNRQMDPTKIHTFNAYGGAVDQRGGGAMEAAKYGALAVLVRSMTLRHNDSPHTGAMHYSDTIPKIPAAAISTNGADSLSKWLKKNQDLRFSLKMSCRNEKEEASFNVVAEIKGTEKPEEIIIAGGHLDSWDLGVGAQDDGAGCVQSIEAMRLFKKTGIKPKRTLRVVMFMNEEFGLRGGTKYAELAKEHHEKHVLALESDGGGASPRGFSSEMSPEQLNKITSWKPLLEPYGLYDFSGSGGGADIGPLHTQGVPVMELRTDSQRYFDVHHCALDTFESVNPRELELGAASMAALMYLVSEHGL